MLSDKILKEMGKEQRAPLMTMREIAKAQKEATVKRDFKLFERYLRQVMDANPNQLEFWQSLKAKYLKSEERK